MRAFFKCQMVVFRWWWNEILHNKRWLICRGDLTSRITVESHNVLLPAEMEQLRRLMLNPFMRTSMQVESRTSLD